MKTLQTKILIGLLPTLAIVVGLGLWAIVMFYRLGGNIDVILRENYTSILAAEGMKEAIERMDSGLLFAVGGRDLYGKTQFDENLPRFLEHLNTEKANITLPGEERLAESLDHLFQQYTASSARFFAQPHMPPERRAEIYFGELKPAFDRIKASADEVLVLNQKNMTAMDRRARANASTSIRLMIGVVIAAVVAGGGRFAVLEPIDPAADPGRDRWRARLGTRRARSAGAGRLARRARRPGQCIQRDGPNPARIPPGRDGPPARAQRTAQATIDSFPDPVVVVDTLGSVEHANRGPTAIGGKRDRRAPRTLVTRPTLEYAGERRACRARRLPSVITRTGHSPVRQRPGALLSAPGRGDPHRAQ